MSRSSNDSLTEWPSQEEGLTIHYKPEISSSPTARGILHYTLRSKPAAHWHLLIDTFEVAYIILNELTYFVNKMFDQAKKDEIQRDLQLACKLAFPGKEAVTIDIGTGDLEKRKGTWIDFRTPSSNVTASEIVTAATLHGWTAGGYPLVKPWYVGFQTTELLHPIKFSSVPEEHKKDFIAALPQFLSTGLDPSHGIEVLDIWENQKRITSPGAGNPSWKFEGDVVALIRVQAPFPPDGDMEPFADRWPGWFHFDDEYLVELSYPGRFDFCKFCKHTAQDLQGPMERHTEQFCIKLTCRTCGHHGHDRSLPDPTGAHRRVCDAGRKRRLEERAAKRQKTTHDGAAQPTTQSTGATQTVQTQASTGTAVLAQSEGVSQSGVAVKPEALR